MFLGVKNNNKRTLGDKKNIRLFSKILSKWTLFIIKMQNFGVFMSNGHVKNGKLFLNVINVHIYAYAHIDIKCFDFLNDF